MFGSIGRMAEFDVSENWKLYEERLEQYFLANRIEKERQVPVLLSVIGSKSSKMVKDLSDPVLPKDRPYEEICDLLCGHFTHTVSLLRKIIDFYNLRQKEDETIGMWFATLKNTSIDCKFCTRLNDVIKDKFVAGLKPGKVLDRICEEDPEAKTLKSIVELALKYEATTKNTTKGIHKLDTQSWRGKQSNSMQFNNNKKQDKYKASLDDIVDYINMFNLSDNNYSKSFTVNVLVNEVLMEMELETGAGVSVLPERVLKEKFEYRELKLT